MFLSETAGAIKAELIVTLKLSACVTNSCRGKEGQGICAVTNHLCVSAGVFALFDQRSPAADPKRPGLGASGSSALCRPGGLLTPQVNRAQEPPQEIWASLITVSCSTVIWCFPPHPT